MAGSVVFDNNAYKRVSTERLARIIEREKAQGIRPLASTTVTQELRNVAYEALGRWLVALGVNWATFGEKLDRSLRAIEMR